MRKLGQLLAAPLVASFVILIVLSVMWLGNGQASPLGRTSVTGVWGLYPESYTSTGAQTITPTNSYYQLAPTQTLTVTLATGDAIDGDTVIFVNTVATDTVFVDSGASQGGSKTLDEDADAIGFRFDGAEWVLEFFVDQTNAVSGGAGSFTTLDTTGNVDVGGTLNYGSDNLYPLGYASSGEEIVCGTTDTFTDSTTIDVTALTTVTYVLATQVTAPAAGGAFLHVSDPTTTTITLTSLDSTFGTGTTGVAAHYCVVGNQ